MTTPSLLRLHLMNSGDNLMSQENTKTFALHLLALPSVTSTQWTVLYALWPLLFLTSSELPCWWGPFLRFSWTFPPEPSILDYLVPGFQVGRAPCGCSAGTQWPDAGAELWEQMELARAICLGRSHPGLQTPVRTLVFINRAKTSVTVLFWFCLNKNKNKADSVT